MTFRTGASRPSLLGCAPASAQDAFSFLTEIPPMLSSRPFQTLSLATLTLSVALLSACAAPAETAEQKAAQATANQANRECEATTGSNLCRKRKGASVAPVASIDGETLRRGGDELVRDKASTPAN